MPTSYSDIKRYNLNKSFLLRAAREVINYLGWDIQQEIESHIFAVISKGNDSPLSRFRVSVYQGYIALNCECDSDLAPHHYFETQKRVNQFIQTLDEHLESTPPKQLQRHKESFGRSLRLT
jgi:hypothetical protein